MKTSIVKIGIAATCVLAATISQAEIVIGASFSITGPAAAIGIAPKNTMQLFPETIAGEKVRIVVLDDATDSTLAVKNAQRLLLDEKVDVIFGSTASPPALAIAEFARANSVVQLAAAPIVLAEGKDAFTFRLPQGIALMAEGSIDEMKKAGVKTLGFLGYSDAYGESWLQELTKFGAAAGIKVTAVERFGRNDSSVTAQALKVLSANPDAVMIVASGSGAVMPQKAIVERGYKGKLWQTYSAVAPDLIKLGGKDVEGTLGFSGPAVSPSELLDSHPSKKVAMEFIALYEGKFGAGSYNQFAANVWGGKLLLEKAILIALKKARPGTPEFRLALRDAIENVGEVVVPQGVLKYTEKDHFGFDGRARFLLAVKNGVWKRVP
ncbi:ABC transporter substrate-binding protein [Polaromonas sp.]|uniref:ABC transporter substrate-binding protein n=1 Tax=Polaromonas sp. TaxID=1869339 RepID=UPI003265A221